MTRGTVPLPLPGSQPQRHVAAAICSSLSPADVRRRLRLHAKRPGLYTAAVHSLWNGVFGNDHPVEVEIGPGTGTFILPAALGKPDINFFGIEHSHSRAHYLCLAIEAQALRNARVIAADATCLVSRIIPAQSISAYHAYFPDPWWKRRHHRRRVFTPGFAAALAHTLVPGGRIYIATDVDAVFALALSSLARAGELVHVPDARSPRTGATTFERKGIARGAVILEAVFAKPARVDRSVEPYANRAAPITPAESPS
jgi:tRNA (guanine-N7-)-methyltransferase